MLQKIINNKIISSLFWVSFEKFGYSGIYFISTIILARLLTPSDFGIIGILAVFISFSQMIVESGLGGALVKKEIATTEDYNTIFTFNLGIGIFLYIILFFCAPLIANFYNNGSLVNITRLVGLNIILSSLTLTQRVHLIRELQFKKQSIISIIAITISVFISILLAYFNFGVWALVAQQLLYNLFYFIIIFRIVKYIPRIQFVKESFKHLYSFGSKIFGASLLSIVYSEGISSLIAKYYSVLITGLYYQAKKLVDFPVSIFRALGDNVVFPVLSRISNEEEFSLKAGILMKLILGISLPLFVILYFYSEMIVHIVLGPNWIESGKILNILCLSSVGLIIDTVNRNILKATGNGTAIIKSELYKKIIGFILLFIFLKFDLYLFLYSIVIGNIIGCIINMLYVSKLSNYSLIRQVKDILPILLIGIGLGYFFNLLFDNKYIIGILSFLACYILIVLFLFKKVNIKNLLNE